MSAKWRREDFPYDAMGDFSAFEFEDEEEETECEDRASSEEGKTKNQ